MTRLFLGCLSILGVLSIESASAPASAQCWPVLGGDAAHSSLAPSGPALLRSPRWNATLQPGEAFVGRSVPVACDGKVVVLTRVFAENVHVADRLIAFAATDGARLWSADVPADVFDSLSSPTIDAANGAVLVGTGSSVTARRLSDGGELWDTTLARTVVNATAVVSTGLGGESAPANRAFITDSDFGPASTLYAINVDPFNAAGNPFQPGEVAWSADIPGSVGSTPAYADGTVYVATTTPAVLAFDAADGSPLWETSILGLDSFFGGVCVANGAVYGATYNFNSGANNSRLIKLDAATGDLLWTTWAERSSSIPVVVDDAIYLAAGIDGFGSNPRVQKFQDAGASATLVWDTHADTAGALRVGDWNHQPVWHAGHLFVGVPDPVTFSDPYLRLVQLDLSLTPGSPDFVTSTHVGSGSSPAMIGPNAYSFGSDGLFALVATVPADLNCDGVVNNFDIDPFVLALTDPDEYAVQFPACDAFNGDINGDGLVNNFDIDPFVARLTGD